MKIRNRVILAWTARVLSWLYLAALLGFVVWKHEGIALRAQLVRLMLDGESEAALRWILARPGVGDRLDERVRWIPAHGSPATHGLPILVPFPTTLHLITDQARPRQELIFGFDSDGRLAGAPVEVPRSSSVGTWTAFNPMLRIVRDVPLLILVSYPQMLATTTAITSQGMEYRAYRLDFPRSELVFAVRIITTGAAYGVLQAAEGSKGGLELQLTTYPAGAMTTSTQAITPVITRFPWEASSGRFTGPDRDPNGAWEVVPIPANSNGE